mmetsp:Transcript_45436/g.119987  ORF Transcript_45436/g.119987 Transcript_45436/m.119987 type:complete len:257 (-) Transcript_45436:13-783(-)
MCPSSALAMALARLDRSGHEKEAMRPCLMRCSATQVANPAAQGASSWPESRQTAQHKLAMACGANSASSRAARWAAPAKNCLAEAWHVRPRVTMDQLMLERPCGLNSWMRRNASCVRAQSMYSSASSSAPRPARPKAALGAALGAAALGAGRRQRKEAPSRRARAQMVMESSWAANWRMRSGSSSWTAAATKPAVALPETRSRATAQRLLAKPCAAKPCKRPGLQSSSKHLRTKHLALLDGAMPSLAHAQRLLARH